MGGESINRVCQGTIVAFAVLGHTACGPGVDQAERERWREEAERERALLLDPVHGVAEFKRRFREHIDVDHGNLILTDSYRGAYVVPAESPWVISCFPSMTLIFVGGIENSEMGSDNLIELRISRWVLTREDCVAASKIAGQALRAVLGE